MKERARWQQEARKAASLAMRVLAVLLVLLLLAAVAFPSQLLSLGLHLWARQNLQGELQADVRVHNDSIELRRVALRTSDGSTPLRIHDIRVAFDLWRALQSGSFVGGLREVSVQEPHVELLRRSDGSWNLAAVVKPGGPAGPPMWAPGQFGGGFKLVGGTVQFTDDMRNGAQLAFQNLAATVDARQGPLHLTLSGSQAGAARVSLSVELDRSRTHYHLHGNCRGLDLFEWGRFALAGPDSAPVQIQSGVAELSLAAWGALRADGGLADVPDVVMRGHFRDGAFAIPLLLRANDLAGSFSATGDSIQLEDVAGRVGPLRMRVAGTVYDRAQPQLQLNLRVDPIRLKTFTDWLAETHARLRRELPQDLDGLVHADVALAGAPSHPVVDGSMAGSFVQWSGHRVLQPRVSFAWDHDSVLLRQIAGQFQGGQVSGNGFYFPQNRSVWLQVHARDVGLPGLPIAERGGVDATVVGAVAAPFVHGAARLASDAPRHTIHTQFTWHDGTLLLRHGAVAFKGGVVDVPDGMVDTRAHRLYLALQGSHVAVPPHQAGLLGMVSGTLDFTGQIAGSLRHPVAQGEVTGGTIDLGRIHVTDVQAAIASNLSTLVVPSGRAIFCGEPVYFTLSSLITPPLAMDISLYAPLIDFGPLKQELPWHLPFRLSGLGSAWSEIAGQVDNIWTWRSTGRGPAADFVTEGSATPAGFRGYASASHVDLHRVLPPELDHYDVHGWGRGVGVFSGRDGRVHTQYVFESPGGTVNGLPVTSGTGVVDTREDDVVTMHDNDFFGPAGIARLDGTVGRKLHLHLSGIDLDLGVLSRCLDLRPWNPDLSTVDRWLHQRLPSGLAQLQGLVTMGRHGPCFTGGITVPRGVIAGKPFWLDTRLSLDQQRLRLLPFLFEQGGSEWRASGDVLFGHPLGFDLALSTPGADVADLLALTRTPLPLSAGRLAADLHLSGTYTAPLLSGRATLQDAQVLGQTVSRVSGQFSTHGRQLRVDSLEARVPGGTVTGHGTVGPGHLLDFDLLAPELQLRAFQPSVDGQASVALHLSGHTDRPLGDLRVDASNLRVAGHPLQHASLLAHLQDDRLQLLPLEFKGDVGTVQVRGEVRFSRRRSPQLDMQADLQNAHLGTFFAMIPGQPWPRLSHLEGSFDGTLGIAGTLAAPSFKLLLKGAGVRLGDSVFGNVTARGSGGPQALRVDEVSFESPQSQGTLHGTVQAGQIDGEAHVRGLEVAGLAHLLPWEFPVGGRLKLDARAQGRQLDVAFALTHGTLNRYAFDTFAGRVVENNGVLALDHIEAQRGTHRLSIAGNVPLDSGQMLVTANVDDGDLSALSLVVPYLESTQGTMKAHVTATGTFQDVQLDGSIAVQDGALKFGFMNDPVQDIAARISLSGHRVNLDQLSARLGTGLLHGGGFVSLDHFFAGQLALYLQGQGVGVSIPRYYTGLADVDVKLEGTLAQPRLTGRLVARDGNVTLPDVTAAASTGEATPFQLPHFDFDLAVAAGENLNLHFMGSVVKTRGELRLVGTPPHVRPAGELKAYGGNITLPLFGQFKVEQGKTLFDGQHWLPYLDIVADTTINGYQVFLRWKGDLKDPPRNPASLSSNPPLSTDDILALLSGRLPSTGSAIAPMAAANFTNNVFQVVSNQSLVQPLLQSIGRLFAISDVSVEYLFPNTYSVKLARSLDPMDRFFFTLTRIYGPQGEEGELYGLELHP
ncbi:MAG: translocation/assembly module TamB domain-containing protein, partial [Candidatus Xenobia bacterium]